MRKRFWIAIMAGVLGLVTAGGFAQTVNFDYQDISRRNTQRTEREQRKKREAEAAKKKAEEEKRRKEREERSRRWQDERDRRSGNTQSSANRTTGSRATAVNEGRRRTNERAGKAATAPVTTGGSYDPTTRQVTEVMLDAVKTQHVKFDPSAAREDPSIILLNPPRHDPEDRHRAADITGIGRPL